MFEKIKNMATWVKVLIEAVIAVAGVFSFVYVLGQKAEHKKNENNEIIKAVNETRNMVIELRRSDSLQIIHINTILANQADFGTQIADQTKKLDNLNMSYINHLKTDKKVDELIMYLESEKKNKDLSLYQIPRGPKP